MRGDDTLAFADLWAPENLGVTRTIFILFRFRRDTLLNDFSTAFARSSPFVYSILR